MKLLEDKEIGNLASGDKIHLFNEGDFERWIFAAKHPEIKDMFVFINGYNFCKSECIHKHTLLERGYDFYERKTARKIRTDYYNSKIESINERL